MGAACMSDGHLTVCQESDGLHAARKAVAMLCAGAVAIALSAQRLACCVAPKGTGGSSKGCGKAGCRCSEGPAGSIAQAPNETRLLVPLDNACNAHKQCPKICLPVLHDTMHD